jgi:magnesium chelatase family protein
MLVASMNPCPCGYYGSKEKECTCSETAINKYMNRLSGPLLDRIDIQVKVNPVKYTDLKENEIEETSTEIRKRVNKAREKQRERYKEYKIFSNSELNSNLINKFCILDEESEKLLHSAFERLKMSARAYTRILKVARTIADLDNSEEIKKKHIAEAIQYRSLDRKYWTR